MLQLGALLLVGLVMVILSIGVVMYRELVKPPALSAGVAAARGWWMDPSDADLHFDEWDLVLENHLHVPMWELNHPHDTEGPALIMIHDLRGSRISSLQRIPAMLPHVSRIGAFDLPGHGEARSSSRSSLGSKADQDIVSHVMLRVADGRPIVLYGFGLGASMAINTACAHPESLLGVIVEAPVRTADDEIRSILDRYGLVSPVFDWLLRFAVAPFARIQNIEGLTDRVRSLSVPLLVLQGSDVSESESDTARALADAVSTSSEYVEVDCSLADGEDLASVEILDRTVRDFVNACIAQSERRRPTPKTSSMQLPPIGLNQERV